MKIFYGFDQMLTMSEGDYNVAVIEKGAVAVKDTTIVAVAKEKEMAKMPFSRKAEKIKIRGVAMPAFVDSHTHAVFAKPRLEDFSLRASGLTYKEIKRTGAGIISSIKALRKARQRDLEKHLLGWIEKFAQHGSATVEVKSGYGLDAASEIKILETIRRASHKTPVELIPTFLGAHSVPPEFKKSSDYLDFLVKKVLPQIKKKKLAVFADIFCEDGYFSPTESKSYLLACLKAGLRPKIHAEQMKKYGGAQAAIAVKAVSADHMDYATLKDIRLVAKNNVVVTFLPASNYFLGLSHFPNAKNFIENGVCVALASDFNPGTCPCINMQFVVSCAVTHMKMTIDQALFAATFNGAKALGIESKTGSIEKGKQADIAVMATKDYREIAYYFGSNLNLATIKKGEIIYEKGSAI